MTPPTQLPSAPAHNASTERPAAELLDFQSRIESNARSYPRRLPMVVSRASGAHIYDSEGRRFIDCLACAGALPLGHNHPEVTAAAIEYMQSGGAWQTLDLMTPAKAAYIDTLFDLLPSGWRDRYRIQFCGPGGSDAVEAAVKLVKIATGRSGMLAFRGAYHGMSHYSLGMTGNLGAKSSIASLASGVHFLPYPDLYRSALQSASAHGRHSEAEISETNLHYVRSLLNDPESGMPLPAGVILELVQGEGGVNPAPLEWVRGLRALTAEKEIPLIVDEVQTGLGRTGHLFAFEAAGIEPDVLVLSKAVGGGFPIALVLFREELNQWAPGSHAGTFRGNQIAMVTGRRTMEVIREENLVENVRTVGGHFRGELERLQSRFAMFGHVRGRGLMLGVEIVDPTGAQDTSGFPAQAPRLAALIQKNCFERGLILEVGGRFSSVLRFLPPLNITEALVEEIIGVLTEASDAAEEAYRMERKS